MNIEEKLKHFESSSIEAAEQQSHAMLSEHEAALEKIFQDHKEKKLRQASLQIKTESERLQRIKNRELSNEQLLLKKNLNKRQNELKEMLFVEVRNLLSDFMNTREYDTLLIQEIKEARDFAKDAEIIIYIDPADSSRLQGLEVATNTKLSVSDYSFSGGIRAVIPSKNVLIDNSFETKLAELKEEFYFNGR